MVYKKIGTGATVFSGYAFKSESLKANYGVPVIKIGNLQNRTVDYSETQFIAEINISERMKKFYLDDKDVLIAMTGQGSVGRVSRLNKRNPNDKLLLNQRVGKFVCDSSILNSDYLYFVLSSDYYQEILFNLGTGSGQPNLSPMTILNVEIPFPNISSQNKIAEILNLIEDKIQNNNRINDYLLQQVTACFHHYFDAYEASSDAIAILGDVAKFKYGTMPKKDKLGNGQYVAFSGYQVVGSYPEKMFSDPQLIIVARGVGGCGDIKYTPSNCYLTNLSIAILSKNVAIEDYLFNYLRLHDTKVMNTGSAQPQITVSTLEKYQLPIPPEDLLASFSTFVQPFKNLYRKNNAEIERLQMLRDTLLPRLMSGELDVSNIDI